MCVKLRTRMEACNKVFPYLSNVPFPALRAHLGETFAFKSSVYGLTLRAEYFIGSNHKGVPHSGSFPGAHK